MIKRNLMTYAMLLLINILLFISCNQKDYMDIIWRDFTENGYHGEIEIGLAESSDDPESKYQHFKLRANETRRIKNYGMRDIYYKSRDPGACIDYYQNPKFPNKLEIFLIDEIQIKKNNDKTLSVPKAKNVEAYYLTTFDKENDKIVDMLSKDNILKYERILTTDEALALKKKYGNILKCIENGNDLAYYSYHQEETMKRIEYAGYVIKSKIDGSYCWIDTFLH